LWKLILRDIQHPSQNPTPNLLLAPSLYLGINLPTVRFSQASQIAVRLTGFTEPPAGQLRLANPDTIKFTADLVKNVASMFPSKYFSTGGDEINANCYAMDNQTQQELGMSLVKWIISIVIDIFSCVAAQNKTFEQALDTFTQATHNVLATAGKTPVVWEGQPEL